MTPSVRSRTFHQGGASELGTLELDFDVWISSTPSN